ncbi:hypothetical protein GEMRC1_013990 [Eukaryota sp. GEM-RC1]
MSALLSQLEAVKNDFDSNLYSTEDELKHLESLRESQVECALQILDIELTPVASNEETANADSVNDPQFDELLHNYDTIKLQLDSLFQKMSQVTSSSSK